MSTIELAKEFDLNQKTCWYFKRRVQEAMSPTGRNKLGGTVHVDELQLAGLKVANEAVEIMGIKKL